MLLVFRTYLVAVAAAAVPGEQSPWRVLAKISPGASAWLNVPYHSASIRFLKRQCHIGAIGLGPYYQGILLLLIAVILLNLGLEQHPIGLILGLDEYSWLILLRVNHGSATM
jgi:hypothetical protein